jgi:hypothetical protein
MPFEEHMRSWEDNIKIDLKIGRDNLKSVRLAYDRDQLLSLVVTFGVV